MLDAEPTIDTPRILVVGGVSRKAGKTSLVEGILRTFSQRAFSGQHWTAVKISSHVHASPTGGKLLARRVILGRNPVRGAEVDPADFRLWEETVSSSATDTGRFLAAGAARALLLEANDSHLGGAVASLMEVLRNARAGCIICETTRAAPLLRARLFLMVVGSDAPAAKASGQRMGPLADAIVVCAPAGNSTAVRGVVMSVATPKDNRSAARREGNGGNLTSRPVFRMEEGGDLPADLRFFIDRRFLG
jgi:hypothetical protein